MRILRRNRLYMHPRLYAVGLWMACVIQPPAFSQNGMTHEEETAVLKVVQQFFQVLENKDTTLAREILISQAVSHSVREERTKIHLKSMNLLDAMKILPHQEEILREIIHQPKVFIHNRIAMVWAEYDFFRNGVYSHNGVDAFSLIKTIEGWKIAGIVYTIEPPDP